MRWARIALYLALTVVGVALGGLSVVAVLRSGAGQARLGPWFTSLETGGPDASAYTRARVAAGGLFALNREETLYFNAPFDDGGQRLRGNCTYRLVGQELPARWWSITAYGPDNYLIPNSENRYSFSQSTVAREADGSFVIWVSGQPKPGNWIPVAPGRAFDLTARLYNPDLDDLKSLGREALPVIEQVSCS